MASFAHIGSWSDDRSPPGNMYPLEIETTSSTSVKSLSHSTDTWLSVQRTPKNNMPMECLLCPALYDGKTSAPWHGVAQVETARAATEMPVHSTKKEANSTNKSVEWAKSWSVIGRENGHATKRI